MRLDPSQENIGHCSELLRAGEVVAVPTETVYGLAGNALNESAARRIFNIKGRPLIDPLICHFASIEEVSRHIFLSKEIKALAKAFWPGALTIVAKKRACIPDIVTAGLSSAAVRIPEHPVFRILLEAVGFPLAAPSANPFGYVSPTSAEQVEQTLGKKIPAILDAGTCAIGIESTIIDMRNPSKPSVLRLGPIQLEDLQQVLGTKIEDRTEAPKHPSSDSEEELLAPGRLSKHYSPHTKVDLLEHGIKYSNLSLNEDTALLLNQKPTAAKDISNRTYWLSEDGKLETIAHNLFSTIQKLDCRGYHSLLIERCIDEGIGRAINDRLQRASARH